MEAGGWCQEEDVGADAAGGGFLPSWEYLMPPKEGREQTIGSGSVWPEARCSP